MSLTNYDFAKVCRTCLSTSNLKPLYQKNATDDCLDDMLMICTAMEFSETDGLPLQICNNCITELNQSYKFALKCRETDTQLRMHLQSVTADENILPQCTNIICGQNYETTALKDPLEISNIKTELHTNIDIKNEPELITDSFEHIPQFTDDKLEHYEASQDERPDISGMPILQDSNQTQEVYQCNNCRKCFYSFYMLNQHHQWPCVATVDESIEKQYNCTHCDRKFMQKHSLTKHMRTHTGEKPFACKICYKSFNVKASLSIHLRTHTGERPYSCEYCSAMFKQPQHLKGHLNTQHYKTKTERAPRSASKIIYLCTECNTTYTRKYQLKIHMREHAKEKYAFACTICSTTFKDESSLSFHMYTHTGEKPYSCTMCDRSFNLQSNLTCHMRIHSY